MHQNLIYVMTKITTIIWHSTVQKHAIDVLLKQDNTKFTITLCSAFQKKKEDKKWLNKVEEQQRQGLDKLSLKKKMKEKCDVEKNVNFPVSALFLYPVLTLLQNYGCIAALTLLNYLKRYLLLECCCTSMFFIQWWK